MSAWSKGQWVLDECDPRNRVTIYSGETVICDYDTSYVEYGTDEEVIANAHLIAQAPAMYEALERLYSETADYIKTNNLGDVHHNQSMKDARDVLAAARGDSHG